MKVLIVSFDKSLTEELKKALEGHEVYIAKNSEEAIKVIPSDIEGIIYDAISGAISEEDINTLYTKKFSTARYVILYDELFPVDESNIIAEHKILVPREESPKEIVRKLVEFPTEEEVSREEPETVEQEKVEDIESLVQEIGGETEEIEIEHTSLDTGSGEEPVQEVEEVLPEAGKMEKESVPTTPGKILIVSFDQPLIDSLKASLGPDYEVVTVKTVKQAMEKGKDASVVVFDAISGVIAEKGLTELSQDSVMASKPYIILVDDLFPIDISKIPLPDKESLSRDTDPDTVVNLIKSKAVSAPATQVEEPKVEVESVQQEETSLEEELEKIEEVKEEQTEQLEEVIQELETVDVEEVIEEIEPPSAESEAVEEVEVPKQEEEHIPALEALEKVMEEGDFKVEETAPVEEVVEEIQQSEEEVKIEEPSELPKVELGAEEVSSTISQALTEDMIKEAVSKALEERMADIREMVADIVRKEVEKAFEDLDIRNLIRQATYQALRDKLEELIS